jgi:valyl-tRNA synthetase
MPFITEALWRRFPGRPDSASISIAPWPAPDQRARDPEALKEFGLVQELISAIRAIRAEYGVQPGQLVRAVVSGESEAASAALKHERPTITRLAKLSELSLGETRERVGGHAVLSDGTAVFVPLGDAIDLGRECGRLGTEVDRLRKLVESQEKKLGNEQFVSRAPTDVVERERQKLTAWKDQREVLVKKRELLGCS